MQTENVPAETAPPPVETEAAPPPPEKVENPEESRPPEGFVPQQALHAANIARRRVERDLAEERMKWETANKRLEEISKRFAPAEVKPPDANEDPVGAITHETRQTREEVAALRREREEEKKASATRDQQAEIERHWSTAAQSFAQKQADFPQAYEHLFKTAMEEFQETYDERTAGQLVQGYWRDIVLQSQKDGINPAERMYNIAKRRGYRSAKAEDKLDTIVNGSKATSPLSASGKAPSRLTAESIAEMKQEEFDKLSDADFKRIFGA
jgi:hypothetical protein